MEFFIRLEQKNETSGFADNINLGPYGYPKDINNKTLAVIMLDNLDIMDDDEKAQYKEHYQTPSDDISKRPAPSSDEDLSNDWEHLTRNKIKSRYVFGFRNLKAYRKWFSNEIGRELVKEQARLAIYKVNHNSIDKNPNVIHGQLQSIARVECLELVKTIPVTSKGYLGQYLKSVKKKLKKSC